MKNIYRIATLFCLLLLVGCSSNNEKFSAKATDHVTGWNKKRTKLFSTLEYLEVDQKEAEKLMQKKFELEMPLFLSQSLSLAETTFTKKGIQPETSTYSIVSGNETLNLQGQLGAKDNQNNYLFYVTAKAKFQVNREKEVVYLVEQSVFIQNSATNEAPNREELLVFLKELGIAMEISEIDDVIQKATKKMDKEASELAGKKFVFFDDSKAAEKEKRFARILSAVYSEEGTLKEVYAELVNYAR